MVDGERQGLRPAEFEVDSWHDLSPVASEVERLTAERNALQLRLNAADQRIDELERDKRRLDAIEANFWNLCATTATRLATRATIHRASRLSDTGWISRPIG